MSARGLPRHAAAEHEFEAQPGLPEPLPRGERLLWQGSPDWRVLAREALHTRLLAVYFAGLLALRAATVLSGGGTLLAAAESVLILLPLAVLALGVLAGLAWLIARTSVYTITDKRIVMRIGVVLNITFNLPFSQVESAGLRSNRDGSGDLSLLLNDVDHIAYVHLWPHARPWHVKRTQPMLRALPQVQAVAAILTDALANAAHAADTAGAPTLRAVPASSVPARQSPANAGQRALAA